VDGRPAARERELSPTPAGGLSTAEAAQRLAAGWGNGYRPATSRPVVDILRANLLTLFNLVVGGSFVLLLVLGYWQDALFGIFMVLNAAIGVVQEVRAKITLDRLTVLTSTGARVLRDGATLTVPAAQIVRGDLLVLAAGDEVVADARVTRASGLGVDESLLTGESEPVAAVPGRELRSGSFVVAGRGYAEVIRVGADSYANRVAADLRAFTQVGSELRLVLARVIRWISWILLPLGLLVLNGQIQASGGWAVAGESGAWRSAALLTVACIVSMVPQGLIFMTSVGLAVGAVTLSRRRVLVQELPAVEMLARVDALCFDKTGTLTDGTMVLRDVQPVGEGAGWPEVLGWFAVQDGANATARALRERFREIPAEQPELIVEFSSSFRWSAVVFGSGACAGTWVLGAPDTLLPESPVRAQAARSAAAGRRTLVLAHRATSLTADDAATGSPPVGLTAVALLEFQENVREDAAATVAYFRREGVRPWVFSGDHPATVAAIAREAGIDEAEGFDATELPGDSVELDELLQKHAVFGRVGPDQKTRMVEALRARGYVVAMTGDGVNDAPALKHADLGIAMGSGAAITRASAHLVLLNGQFSELPQVVAEGRRVIGNVERLAKLFLTKTVYAITLAVVFGAVLWPYPFLPRQLSAVDGLTIGLPAIVLAVLPNNRRYRAGFLARASRFCLPAGLIVGAMTVAVVLALRVAGRADDVPTAGVITLTLLGLWVLGIVSRPMDRIRLAVLLAGYLGLVALLAIPFAAEFFSLALPATESLVVVAAASIVGALALEGMHRLGWSGSRDTLSSDLEAHSGPLLRE
jgi:cation-transporting ATPase E